MTTIMGILNDQSSRPGAVGRPVASGTLERPDDRQAVKPIVGSVAPVGASGAPSVRQASGGRRRRPRGPGGDGASNPPLLTGGLLRGISRRIDFLTISVVCAVAELLERENALDEVCHGRPGFARSERRLTIGGRCWRRFEPAQPSKYLGSDYESWEWDGYPAHRAAERLSALDGCRPSRVDMAFDFECPEEFTADDLLPHYESWARAKAISLGISGQSDVNTRYVGSTSSERRIRVYRKDLQQLVIGELLGPLLRIELELKGKQAAAWWEVWRRSPENAYAVAAGHIHEMTGLAMQEAIQEVPSLQEPDASDEAEELFQFLCQHGDRLAAWEKAGIPVVPMAIEHARKATNRTRQKRQRDREMALAMVDVDQLQGIVRRLLKLSPNLI